MRWAFALWLPLAACASPAVSSPDAAALEADAASPAATDVEADPDSDADLGPAPVHVAVPARALAGSPVPLVLRVDGRPTGDFVVDAGGEAVAVRVHHGAGSTLLALAAGTHDVGGASVAVVDQPDRVASERVDVDTPWGPDEVVVVEGEVRVGAGATLTIERSLVLLGQAGALRVEPGGALVASGAFFVGGGGDPSRAFGHSGSQPVLRVDQGVLSLVDSAVLDAPGKAIGAEDAVVELTDVLISRVDTGGELVRTRLTAQRCWWVEIPDADGVVADDDNDGLYLQGVWTDADGAAAPSTLTDVVFAVGEDDAIDHNDALVLVERAWIEGFEHEGVAASAGRVIEIRDSVVRGCAQGVEAGYGDPEVTVDRVVITDCGVGVRFGDSYDWGSSGHLAVRYSVVTGNQEADLWNHDRALGGPREGAVDVVCSVVGPAGAPALDDAGCPLESPLPCDQAAGPTQCPWW